MPFSLELMPLEERPVEPPPSKTIVVRYGYLRWMGEFPSDLPGKAGCGAQLVLRTDRGTEIGELVTTVCKNGGCGKSVTREKMLEYIDASGGDDYPFTQQGRVLRVATPQDLAEQKQRNEHRMDDLKLFRELVARHQLPMKAVDVEYLLGGERVLFYFFSEHRVDFRHLVRDLASALHVRIELRQVGARDEARLVADYEKCGQHCCCKQFLKVLTPISMRSAKIQKATLDPAKISGRCGRLMCCLRYEDQTYEELRKALPKRGANVGTPEGNGMVIDGQILTQLVLVEYPDGRQVAVPMEHITAPTDKPPERPAMQGPPRQQSRQSASPDARPQQKSAPQQITGPRQNAPAQQNAGQRQKQPPRQNPQQRQQPGQRPPQQGGPQQQRQPNAPPRKPMPPQDQIPKPDEPAKELPGESGGQT